MSFNAKTIAVSVVALLAAAGGLYLVIPSQETPSANHSRPTETLATTKPASAQTASNQPNVAEVDPKGADASVATPVITVERQASQAPKKLTQAQLTPPPPTEEEKLQMAAQQESNF